MCCPLDQVHGRLVVQSVGEGEGNDLHLRGVYERTPLTWADWVFRIFQRLELAEKFAEIFDESFHLSGSILQSTTSPVLYQTFSNLHHAAHEIEHLLHAVCFIGDLSRVVTGRFFHDEEGKNLDYIRSAALVCHAVSHFLATLQFLEDHNLIKLNRFQPVLKFMPLFSSAGYAMWTAALIWRRHQGEENNRFAADLGVHLGGFLFVAIPLAKDVSEFAQYASVIKKLSALAGIIHAWCVVDRLMPQDREEFDTKFTLPDEFLDESSHHDHDEPKCEHSPHEGHHHHHKVRYFPVNVS